MQLDLQQRVARNTNASPDDVRHLKKALNRLGYYLPDSDSGITSIADEAMISGVKKFQADHGLVVDGIILPDGKTAYALNQTLLAQEKKWTGQLQWHCAKDKNSCAACLAWDDAIVMTNDENTPGCKGKCRCWVTMLKKGDKFRIYDPPAKKEYIVENLLTMAIPAGRLPLIYRYGRFILEGRNPDWKLGEHKSVIKWENQFGKRGWNDQQVTEVLKLGKKYPAPNNINPANQAFRYQYKGKFVVRDEITGKILQVSQKKNFKPLEITK